MIATLPQQPQLRVHQQIRADLQREPFGQEQVLVDLTVTVVVQLVAALILGFTGEGHALEAHGATNEFAFRTADAQAFVTDLANFGNVLIDLTVTVFVTLAAEFLLRLARLGIATEDAAVTGEPSLAEALTNTDLTVAADADCVFVDLTVAVVVSAVALFTREGNARDGVADDAAAVPVADRSPFALTSADAVEARTAQANECLIVLAITVVVLAVAEFLRNRTTLAAGVQDFLVRLAVAVVVQFIAELFLRAHERVALVLPTTVARHDHVAADANAAGDLFAIGVLVHGAVAVVVDPITGVVLGRLARDSVAPGVELMVFADHHATFTTRANPAFAGDTESGKAVIDNTVAVVVETVAHLAWRRATLAALVQRSFVDRFVAVVVETVAHFDAGHALFAHIRLDTVIRIHTFVRRQNTVIRIHTFVRRQNTVIRIHTFVRRRDTVIRIHTFVRRQNTVIRIHTFVRRQNTVIRRQEAVVLLHEHVDHLAVQRSSAVDADTLVSTNVAFECRVRSLQVHAERTLFSTALAACHDHQDQEGQRDFRVTGHDRSSRVFFSSSIVQNVPELTVYSTICSSCTL